MSQRNMFEHTELTDQIIIDKINADGQTPLHLAVLQEDITKVRDYLKNGANPNEKDKNGQTPLHNAHNPEIIEILLEQKAHINAKDNNGCTALHFAKNLEQLQTLFKHNAILSKDNQGLTPVDSLTKTLGLEKFFTLNLYSARSSKGKILTLLRKQRQNQLLLAQQKATIYFGIFNHQRKQGSPKSSLRTLGESEIFDVNLTNKIFKFL